MSDSKFTPGTWDQGDEHFDGAGSWVAIDGPDSEDIAWVRCEQGDPRNALLIVAAPDLLYALENTAKALERYDSGHPLIAEACIAIAKARGETQ